MAVAQQTPPREQPQEQPRAEAVKSVSGTIKNVDVSLNQVTLETADKQEVSFTVDGKTKVTRGDQPGTFADLKKGQSITVEVQGSTAISISISG